MAVDERLWQQAIAYFSGPGFARLMPAMAERYRRLGRVGGSVRLHHLSEAERTALSGVLGRDFSGQNEVAVGLAEFEQALARTRFGGLDLVELLGAVTGESMQSRAATDESFAVAKARFFAELRERFPQPRCRDWLQYAEANPGAVRSIHSAYKDDAEQLQADLEPVLIALSQLPSDAGTVKRLPVWAAELTGDPHTFDQSEVRGRYLQQALSLLLQQAEEQQVDAAADALDRNLVFDAFGIVRDDVMNFVICCGLLAENATGPLGSWQAALAEGAVLNVPVRELAKLSRVVAAPGWDHRVFVVENPGVFSDLLDGLPGIVPPLVCTHGQFQLASYLLLDKLAAAGMAIHYSGDHDPEGLLMADRLSRRYGRQFRPWRFSVEDYAVALSDRAISAQRLKQLQRVTTPGLLPLCERMQTECRAGYQERLLPLLLQDLQTR